MLNELTFLEWKGHTPSSIVARSRTGCKFTIVALIDPDGRSAFRVYKHRQDELLEWALSKPSLEEAMAHCQGLEIEWNTEELGVGDKNPS
jgi:hypothetical protein